ncbi:MAG TPA: HAMP domain-containing sensor histidine kinase [Pelobium sp.]
MKELLHICKKAALKIIGTDEKFSLKQQIFNLFSLLVCVTAFFCFFINIYIGLYQSAALTIVIIFTNTTILYLSRVKKRFKLSVLITGIELYFLLAINYFVNSGIQGPTILLFLAALYLLTSVGNYKSIPIWLVLNISLVALLFGVEYFYPESILVRYESRVAIFEDIYSTYIVMVVLISTAIIYQRVAYAKQRKALETKAWALEKLNLEKTKLFSIISHDLRSPIASVQQYLDFLQDKSLSESERTTIEKGLVKATNEAYELLDNLLVWSKSQLGGVKAMLRPLNLNAVLALTLTKAKEYAEQKNIVITEDIAQLKVIADEDMLQMVVRNLLFNAIKFSKNNSIIEFSAFIKNENAIIKIKDFGTGISEENQKAMFSLNIKSSVGTNKEKGTGLGLILSNEYALLQNGTLWFESRVGIGSTFYLSLPIAV